MRAPCKILIVIVLGTALSCAGPPKKPLDRVYHGLSESLPRLDPSILRGRKIVIDPGHGGFFRGTVGQDSLEEARVNLGVSLYLWGLLKEAGSEVFLTRSAERDFLTPSDSALASDLQARVSIACSLDADIFISIHHNAQSGRNPGVNNVETYYRVGDPASMDLAFAVHRHLMRNLGISEGEVHQGNYYVLRQTEMPAVLGEASYLTHPPVEKNLKLSEKQRLEAEAYFLGILEYFHRGVPRVHRLSPAETSLVSIPAIVYRTEDTGGLGIDADAVQMQINNQKVEPVFDPLSGRIFYQLARDAPNGTYAVSLGVRNLLGNSSPRSRFNFAINFPPETAVFGRHPEILPPSGGFVRIHSRLLDQRGLPIADGTLVEISTSPEAATQQVAVQDGLVEFPVFIPAGSSNFPITLTCRGKQFDYVVTETAFPGVPLQGVFLLDGVTGAPVTNATVLYGDSIVQTGSQAGLYFLPELDDTIKIKIRTLGYRPVTLSVPPADTLRLTRWFDGKLAGTRFLIDPEGGPASRSGAGKLGLSGAHVNLQVARYLAGYLQSAGATAELTRYSEETRTPQDIVAKSNRFGADRYIEIRHRNAGSVTDIVGRKTSGGTVSASSIPMDDTATTLNDSSDHGEARVFYFPGSRLGAELAQKLSFSLSGILNLPLTPPGELVTFPLQQTACPAVVVEYPPIDIIDEELRLGETWYQRLQAYSIFLGILSHLEVTDRASLTVKISGAEDPSNWLVVVDDTWKLLTGTDGTASFHILSGGFHTVEIQRESSRFLKLVDLAPDGLEELNFFAPPAER